MSGVIERVGVHVWINATTRRVSGFKAVWVGTGMR
jgi:hypothetical protein